MDRPPAKLRLRAAGSGPGVAAAQRPGGPGLVDALHGAPPLLAAVAEAAWPGYRPRWSKMRLVSKACCEAVDAAATRITLAFDQARRQAGGGAWLARMERRLTKLPCLRELTCSGPSNGDLSQLLARPTAARLERLEVHGDSLEAGLEGLAPLLRRSHRMATPQEVHAGRGWCACGSPHDVARTTRTPAAPLAHKAPLPPHNALLPLEAIEAGFLLPSRRRGGGCWSTVTPRRCWAALPPCPT
jgi:hypothetical protein